MTNPSPSMAEIAITAHRMRNSVCPKIVNSFTGFTPRINPPMLIMPRAECFTIFHVLAEGTCWVRVKGEPPLKMEAGDVLVVPQGDEHFMGSDLSLKPKPMMQLIPRIPWPGMPAISDGGGGEIARFVCGYLHCDQKFNPLFGTLPKLLCVQSRGGEVLFESVGKKTQPPQAAVPFHSGMC